MIWTTACALQGTLRPLRTLETLIYQRFQNRHRELICWILPSLLHQSFHIYVFNTFEDWLSNPSQLATTNFFPITGLYTCALVVVPTTETSLYTKSRSFLFRCRSIFATTVKFCSGNVGSCNNWTSWEFYKRNIIIENVIKANKFGCHIDRLSCLSKELSISVNCRNPHPLEINLIKELCSIASVLMLFAQLQVTYFPC